MQNAATRLAAFPTRATPAIIGLADFAAGQEVLIAGTIFHAPACLTYTNFPALDPIVGQRHLDALYVAGDHHLPAITLARLPDATDLIAAGHEDFIPVHNGRVLAEQVPGYWPREDIPSILGTARPRVEIEGSAVLIARYGFRTWGHWLGELLPKMMCVEAAFPRQHRYVMPANIFTDPVLRPLLESIWYHGIDLARIVPVRPETTYRFSKLYTVSSAWRADKIHPVAVGRVRARMQPARPDMPRKVALLRTESTTRNLANAAAVIAELRRRGFTMVEIGTRSFADQVATFAAADTVVSVLGSGLTGLLYAPPGVRVLALAPSRWTDGFFFALMQNRGARLADIRGVQDPTDPRGPAAARFIVELAEIHKGLDALDRRE